MKRSVIETLLGAVVLVVAGFLAFSYHEGNVATPDGYKVYADFAGIGGLKPGDDIEVSGVKIGKVASVELVPDTYLARVHMSLNQSVKLPADTAAIISSESLLGGRYLSIQPGADDELIPNGGRIQYTQAPQNLEELLGKFIFSMQGEKKDKGSDEAAEQPAAAAPAPAAEEPVAQEPAAAVPTPAPATPEAAPETAPAAPEPKP